MMRDQSNQRAAMARLVLGTSRSWRRLVDQELAAHGFSQASALPLIVLLRSEHVRRQSEIADFLHLERPALVRIVDLLVAKGWVERV
ncbi:MAG TPA: MarR family transcriptional regulator, partial [Verrucomicrobiae bacterium]